MFNLSKAQINALAAMQSQLGGAKVSQFDTPTNCTSCYGGWCANGFTG